MPYFQNERGQMKNIGNVFNVFVKYGHIRHGRYLCVCETGISVGVSNIYVILFCNFNDYNIQYN